MGMIELAQLAQSTTRPEDVHLPRHQVIRHFLQRLMLSKALKPGEQIPTEAQLMQLFSVSRITVRQALSQLVSHGVVIARPGRGSFVAEPPIQQDLVKLTGFVEDMDLLGFKSASKVVKIGQVKADYRTTKSPRNCACRRVRR
jgi:GntR family transcriptional regulator